MKLLCLISPEGAAESFSLAIEKQWQAALGTENVKSLHTGQRIKALGKILRSDYADLDLELLIQSVLINAIEFRADAIFIPAMTPFTPYGLDLLRAAGFKVIHWFFEDARRLDYWKDWVERVDLFYAVQEKPFVHYPKFKYLPTACWGNVVPKNNKTFDYVFLGIPSEYRLRFLQSLLTAGKSVCIAGPGWGGLLEGGALQIYDGWYEEESEISFYQQGRMALNLSYDEPLDRSMMQLSPRVFRILQSGTCLASETLPLGNFLWDEIKCVLFDDSTELLAKSSFFQLSQKDIDVNFNLVQNKHHLKQRIAAIQGDLESLL